jgi:hypothetical protein
MSLFLLQGLFLCAGRDEPLAGATSREWRPGMLQDIKLVLTVKGPDAADL